MSLEIKIVIDPHTGGTEKQLAEMLGALGFVPKTDARSLDTWSLESVAAREKEMANVREVLKDVFSETGKQHDNSIDGESVVLEGDTKALAEAVNAMLTAEAPPAVEEPTRKKRRSKEEMTAARAAEAGKTTEPSPAISSSPENRVDPEVAAQDAQDEKAGQDRSESPTRDDVREAVARYGKKFGMPACIKDMPGILGCGVVELPEEKFEEMIAKIDLLIARPPTEEEAEAGLFGSTPTPEKEYTPTPEKEYTRQDVIASFIRYAVKYDGKPPTKESPGANVSADGPVLLNRAVGVASIPEIPNEPAKFRKCVKMIEAAIEANPFNRKVLG